MKKSTKIFYWIVRIITILLIADSIYKITLSNADIGEYIFILANAFGLLLTSFIPNILHKNHIIVSPLLSNIYLAFITAALLFGEIGGFFVYVKGWDSILHLSSGSLITLIGFSLINLLNKNENTTFTLSPIFVTIFAFCFAMTCGAIWEIIEYSLDGIVGSNMQRAVDSITLVPLVGRAALRDTMKDFILNTTGATIISLIGYFDLKREKHIIDKIYIKSENENSDKNEINNID